jgi:AbrB family looped-hinge helix DNA binding protein
MSTTRMSTKGQVIIPKDIRDASGLAPGATFTVTQRGGDIVLSPTKPFARRTIEQIAGILRYDGPPVTLAEMDEGIAREAAARHTRISPRRRRTKG